MDQWSSWEVADVIHTGASRQIWTLVAPEWQGFELELTGRLAHSTLPYSQPFASEGRGFLQGKEALRLFGDPGLRMAPFTSKSAFGETLQGAFSHLWNAISDTGHAERVYYIAPSL